jgi:hypothetical protein
MSHHVTKLLGSHHTRGHSKSVPLRELVLQVIFALGVEDATFMRHGLRSVF